MAEIRLQPKQEEFLSSSADICIGGGAAGGGKSFALTVEPLRHYQRQDFNSICFRRTYPEVMKPGGLWDEATKIYPLIGGVPRLHSNEFIFPKSRLGFGYILNETALMNWKSSQIALIMFDQLETFTERMFFYMASRNRSSCGISSYIRATANPEPNWLSEFLSWWIAEDGYADLSRAGKTRAFIREGDTTIWADTKNELIELHPGAMPKTVTFVPFTIYDNPILLEKDPGYLASLKSLDYIDRERLLGDKDRGGNWFIKPEAGKIFNQDWFGIVDYSEIPEGGIECRYFDTAATIKKTDKSDPDFTAGVSVRIVGDYIYIVDCIEKRIAPAEFQAFIKDTAKGDYLRCSADRVRYLVRWEQEPGSASIRESHTLVGLLRGLDAKGIRASGDKLSNWKPLAAQALSGYVKLVRGGWNKGWLAHMHGQPTMPHDDIADASSGAYNQLIREIEGGGKKARTKEG